jgi:tetratricopeptide (TPR) repeat protein
MVEERIGKGGMGAVYRAVDMVSGARVALKRLGRPTASALVRFKREFHAARRLSHPNCVRVFELGQHESSWFFTMEVVDGGHLEPGSCTPFYVASAACQVLAGLDHIHARQIVHRDVKPQNIIVERENFVAKLSDLGIALVDDSEAAFTVGQRMGSARYLSPEQARGEAADPRTDLYSLGVVIYELLVGAMPFTPITRSFEGWLDAHASTPPKWPTDPALPRELVEHTMRLLSKDPRDRFPTAAAAYDAFAAWLGRTPEGAAVIARIPPLERKGYVAAPEFIGRQHDLQTIDEFVRAALAGERDAPLFLRVFGDGGIGKSRLVSRVLPILDHDGASILFGACPPAGSAPYEPLGALFALRRGSAVRDVPESEAPTRPNTGESPRGDSQQPDLAAREGFEKRDGQLWKLYRGIVDAVIDRSRKHPVVIMIEDLQWADAASLDLLGFVIRALAQARAQGDAIRVTIIVTHRREISPDGQRLVDVTNELGVARAIELRPFRPDEASALVSAMLSVPRDEHIDRFTDRLLAHGEGTPLFISQALRLLVGSGQLVRASTGWNLDAVQTQAIKFPTTVREAIGDRASRLKLGTQTALGIASVKGPRFTIADILPLVDIAEPELLDDMDEAVREGFINEEALEGHYAFAHDRIRESIYDHLPADTKRPIHRAIAEHMYARHGLSKERAAEIAHHAWEGGDARSAYHQWWLAGDQAMQHYAFGRAAEMYTRALEASNALGREPRAALIERHGDACLQAGQFPAARDSYARRLETVTTDLERAELLRRQAEVERRAGNTALAGDLFEHVLRTLRFRVPRTRFGFAIGVVYNVLCSMIMLVFPFLRRKKPRRDRKTQIIARTCGSLAERYFWSDFLRAAFYQFAGLRIAERLGPSPELTVSLAQQGFGVSVYGFYRIGMRYLDRARACGEQVGTPLEQGWQELMRGMSHACAGRVDDHITAERAAERLLAQCPETLRLRQVWTIAGEAYLEAGRLADAERVSTQLLQMSLDVSDTRGQGWARYLQGHLQLWRGEIAEARSQLEEAVLLSTQSDDLTYRLAAAGRLISARIQGGDPASALALGVESARTLAKARLRNPTIVIDGVTLAAAALVRSSGAVDGGTRATVREILRWRGSAARDMRYTTPWYLVGKGAWRRASGRAASGDRLIARGLRLAEDRHLLGEQYELHQYLSRLYASDPARATLHARAGEQLRTAVNR